MAGGEDDPRFSGRQVLSISGDGGFGQYKGELDAALERAIAHRGPSLVEIQADPELI